MTQRRHSCPVEVVMVTYQSEGTLEGALQGLRRSYDEGLIECTIVDNCSTDRTVEILKSEATWAKVILAAENGGFASGCNTGFAYVQSPFTLFVNPDAVVEPTAIRSLVRFLQSRPSVGIAGPAIFERGAEDGVRLQATGARPTPSSILRATIPFLHSANENRSIVPGGDPFRTGWVCGAVFMIRTELLRRLAGFDRRFFLYWEEVDVCHRAEAAGFETWAVGEAVASHIGGASSSPTGDRVSGCIAKHFYESRFHYLSKHYGSLAAAFVDLVEGLVFGARWFVGKLMGQDTHRFSMRFRVPAFSRPRRIQDG